MIESSSSIIKSSIPVYHNAVKSIIFKCAELLMGVFIFKTLSLIAARSKQFTSYLMFTEDYVQRALYISSRGLSRAGLVVLAFSILNAALSLYGTMLWALDSPGYIFRASNATVADYGDQRNDNPPYIIQLYLDASHLQDAEANLPKNIGADLFNPGLNYTLTGRVTNGDNVPQIVKPTREVGIGARIWLDDEGFSVSPDSYSMFPGAETLNGEDWPGSCIRFGGGSAVWNCTFGNAFSQDLVATITGRPEVHWSDASDKIFDSRYITPNRMDNIWSSYGAGGGSALMMQVFTVTKGKKRHTFSESTLKATMLTNPGDPFAQKDVMDLVQRTWSSNETQRSDPLIDQIVGGMMSAQQNNVSYQFGANAVDNGNKTALQSNWGYYTVQNNNGTGLYSLLSITTTNITLIRSETIAEAPQPFEECDRGSFQNEAFGGKVTQTDCAAFSSDNSVVGFFGQVDTAAVMILHGLGNSRSSSSSESLDNDVLSWIWNTSGTIESLLVARAYTVSVNPSLVEISVDKLIVAVSRIQLVLSCLALVLAAIAWLAVMIFADAHWANTLLANLVHATSESNTQAKPGYMGRPPEVSLSPGNYRERLTVGGKTIMVATQRSDQHVYQNFDQEVYYRPDQQGYYRPDQDVYVLQDVHSGHKLQT